MFRVWYTRLLGLILAVAFLCVGLTVTAQGQNDEAQGIDWTLASTYPSTLTQFGTLGKRLEEQLAQISGGSINLTFEEPGAPAPVQEIFDAVGTGSLQAGWSSPGYWAGREPALAIFGAIPFGPPADEYLAWYEFGDGRRMLREIYHAYNIHSVICGVAAPEAAGWFIEPVESVDDLKDLKIRFYGLGARVIEKLGASTELLIGDSIVPKLESGEIGATEFSMPAIDLYVGFDQVAKNYYFPGWHQQSTLLDLTINLDLWNGLSEMQKAQIETACGDNIRYGLAQGEALQFAALEELRDDKGVALQTLPPQVLDALNQAWLEVVGELSDDNDTFAEVWASLSEFRERYRLWDALGYVR